MFLVCVGVAFLALHSYDSLGIVAALAIAFK